MAAWRVFSKLRRYADTPISGAGGNWSIGVSVGRRFGARGAGTMVLSFVLIAFAFAGLWLLVAFGFCWFFVALWWFLLTFGGFGWLLVACVGLWLLLALAFRGFGWLGLFHCCTEHDIPKIYQEMVVILFYCTLVATPTD